MKGLFRLLPGLKYQCLTRDLNEFNGLLEAAICRNFQQYRQRRSDAAETVEAYETVTKARCGATHTSELRESATLDH